MRLWIINWRRNDRDDRTKRKGLQKDHYKYVIEFKEKSEYK